MTSHKENENTIQKVKTNKKRKQSFPALFKRTVLRHLERNNNNKSATGRAFNIDRRLVEAWDNKKNLLMNPRVINNSRKVNNPETKKRAHNNIEEEKLNQWVLDCRNEHICS